MASKVRKSAYWCMMACISVLLCSWIISYASHQITDITKIATYGVATNLEGINVVGNDTVLTDIGTADAVLGNARTYSLQLINRALYEKQTSIPKRNIIGPINKATIEKKISEQSTLTATINDNAAMLELAVGKLPLKINGITHDTGKRIVTRLPMPTDDLIYSTGSDIIDKQSADQTISLSKVRDLGILSLRKVDTKHLDLDKELWDEHICGDGHTEVRKQNGGSIHIRSTAVLDATACISRSMAIAVNDTSKYKFSANAQVSQGDVVTLTVALHTNQYDKSDALVISRNMVVGKGKPQKVEFYIDPETIKDRYDLGKIAIADVSIQVHGYNEEGAEFQLFEVREDSYAKVEKVKMGDLPNVGQVIEIGMVDLAKGNNEVEIPEAESNLMPQEWGSFRDELWSDVLDCAENNAGNPVIGIQRIERNQEQKAVELRATNHIACMARDFPVQLSPYDIYQLELDYQVIKGQAGRVYTNMIGTNLHSATTTELTANSNEWKAAKIVINPNFQNDLLNIHLYAIPGKGIEGSETIVRYANIRLHQKYQKDITDYYLVGNSGNVLDDRYQVLIENNLMASTIKFTELKGAALLMTNKRFGQDIKFKIKSSGYDKYSQILPVESADGSNGWYIDVDKLCKEQQLCTLNADGTYDLELVAEFTPQRWFYVGLIISGTTLAGCLGYLGFVGWRKLRRRRGSGGSRPRGHGDKPVGAAPKRPRSRVVRL